MKQKLPVLVVLCAMVVGLSACITAVEDRGYVIEQVTFDKVKPGMSKQDVRKHVGSPSSVSTLGGDYWYFIDVKQEKSAFSYPDIIQKDIIKVLFDDQGKVVSVVHNDENNHRNIEFVKEETPTEGNQVGVIEQLVGNVGRFNADRAAE